MVSKALPKTNFDCVVLGAGCAGLATAYALLKAGYTVCVVERSDRVGGLAGGIEIGGNTYEFGPHIFHTTDPEILSDVKEIAGHVLLPFERTIQIKFLGRYFSYPLTLTDLLKNLPITTMVHAGTSLAINLVGGWLRDRILGRKPLTNSEQVLKRYYGGVLYKLFFEDYIYKVWGIHPRGLAASFAETRIPRFDFLAILEKLKKLLRVGQGTITDPTKYVEKVEGEFYTTRKGFSLICESYADRVRALGGVILLRTQFQRLNHEGHRATSVEVASAGSPIGSPTRSVAGSTAGSPTNSPAASITGSLTESAAESPTERNGETLTLQTKSVVSTIPITTLVSGLFPAAPSTVQTTAESLRFRGICFVGILVRKPHVLPASFMYFRDKSFNRLTDLAHFKVETSHPGSTLLVAEVTCQPTDEAWTNTEATIALTISEIEAEGLIKRGDVIEAHTYTAEHAYPIYTVGYEAALATATAYVRQLDNVWTAGRQGQFAYVNTHVALKMGYDAARELQKTVRPTQAALLSGGRYTENLRDSPGQV